jgi:hypothetical protein
MALSRGRDLPSVNSGEKSANAHLRPANFDRCDMSGGLLSFLGFVVAFGCAAEFFVERLLRIDKGKAGLLQFLIQVGNVLLA